MARRELPQQALLDTSACIWAFGQRRLADYREFLDTMIEHRRNVLIAAPTVAELNCKYSTPLPRTRHVMVVPFD